MRALVTPVMIVRDEKDYVGEALASLAAAGDVLARPCVYDTGSVDGTQAIAEAAGARVEQGYWDDDFARARNAASAMAATPWVLVLDADERLTAAPLMLRAAVVQAEAQGLDSLVLEVDDVRRNQTVNTAPSIRLIRPAVAEYRNRIHEGVYPIGGSELNTMRLPRAAAHLRHVSYGVAEKHARRQERNARLGELDVTDARADVDMDRLCEALVNRGRSLKLAGQPGSDEAAERDWVEARALPASSTFRRYAGERLVDLYVEQGRVAEAGRLLREVAAEGADPSLLAWLTAQAHAAVGNHAHVVAALREARPPVTALGEHQSIAPVLQTRMLAAAQTGDTELALADAIRLVAEHGVHGFARLTLLLWAERPATELAGQLLAAGTRYAERMIAEFAAVSERGEVVAAELRRCTPNISAAMAPDVADS